METELKSQCPSGHRWNELVQHAQGKPMVPRAGDLTVCVGCGARLIYGPGLALREMTEDDRRRVFQKNPATLDLLDKAHQFIKKGERG